MAYEIQAPPMYWLINTHTLVAGDQANQRRAPPMPASMRQSRWVAQDSSADRRPDADVWDSCTGAVNDALYRESTLSETSQAREAMKREQAEPMTKRQTRIYLAAAVVLHRGHVLLVQRSCNEKFLPGVWGIPCGKLDSGEEPDHAVLRELREETGLNGTVIKHVGSLSFKSKFNGSQVENVQDNYLVCLKTVGGEEFPRIDLPEDDQESMWVPTEEIEDFGLDDHNLAAIQQGLQSVR
jgi:8-oxo-dGTP diphosphatase